MILKILGSFLIISSSYIYGIVKYSEMKNELIILKEFSDSLVYMKNEICFAKTPLYDIVCSLFEKDGVLKEFYKMFLQKYADGSEIEKKWSECCDSLKLTKSKTVLIKKVSECFSYADTKGQGAKLDVMLSQFRSEIEKTEIYMKKNAKLCKNIGLYAGITAAVLLI